MAAYSSHFADSGDINWLPYLMYFHPESYSSTVVNTDSYGFRFGQARGVRYSATECADLGPVRLLVGSSTVFGIGATVDGHTLASRLTERDPTDEFWINFGGRSFNSTQELILFTLHRHLLPSIKEIVLFSGFNDLGLARLPANLRKQHGGFFNCRDFYSAMGAFATSRQSSWLKSWSGGGDNEGRVPGMSEQFEYARRCTMRNLAIWRILAAAHEAKLVYVLQPLATWVRPKGTPEEELLFAELDQRGRFSEIYGDILARENYLQYAGQLRRDIEALGVPFIDFAAVMSATATQDDWLFVDRIHFTDHGNDLAARSLLTVLKEA